MAWAMTAHDDGAIMDEPGDVAHLQHALKHLRTAELPETVRSDIGSLLRHLMHRVRTGGAQTPSDLYLHQLARSVLDLSTRAEARWG